MRPSLHAFEVLSEAGEPLALFRPPILQRSACSCSDIADALGILKRGPGTVLILLYQAGACAAGVSTNGTLEEHKVLKKYVVRGTGRAQPTHLKTRGKSRYGSRLRLRNAVLLREQVLDKLASWAAARGAFRTVAYSCPPTLRTGLLPTRSRRGDPPPGYLHPDAVLIRIPMDVRIPSFDELRRVHRALLHGTLEGDPGVVG